METKEQKIERLKEKKKKLEKELTKDNTLLDFAIGDDELYIGIQEVIFQEEKELARLEQELKELEKGNDTESNNTNK